MRVVSASLRPPAACAGPLRGAARASCPPAAGPGVRPLGRVAAGRFSRAVAGTTTDKIGGAFRGLLFCEAPRAQN